MGKDRARAAPTGSRVPRRQLTQPRRFPLELPGNILDEHRPNVIASSRGTTNTEATRRGAPAAALCIDRVASGITKPIVRLFFERAQQGEGASLVYRIW